MNPDLLVFVGTYTRPVPDLDIRSDGIYLFRLDYRTGALTHISTTRGVINPAYLVIDRQQRYLYAVSEVDERGAVSAFEINPANGELTLLNHQPSHGRGPCYVWVDAAGKWVFVANYPSGSAAVYPVLDDGRLGDATDVIQHEGSGANPDRQEGPHAHCIMTDPTNQFVLLADLGIDRLMVYRLDTENGKLTRSGWAQAAPGAGPRHFDFHPSGQYCFLINELASAITTYRYHDGVLTDLQTISTLPEDFSGENTTAAIHVSPDGRFVYGSNRGHDSIAIYEFDEAAELLTLVGFESSQGRTPRDFMIDPTGEFLIAANQDTHDIYTYRIDPQTGRLTPSGQLAVQVPLPVCLKPYRI